MLLILVPSTPQEADRLYLVMEYCQLSVRYSTFICVCCPQPHKQEADRLYLVMEYCAGGDLAHLLRAVKRLPEAAAQHLMRQLAAGLRQMWAHHLVHVRSLEGCLCCMRTCASGATLEPARLQPALRCEPRFPCCCCCLLTYAPRRPASSALLTMPAAA